MTPEPSAKELSERIAQLTDEERRSINDRLLRTSAWLITDSMQSLAGYRDLADRLASTEAENAALRADKERLDWLDNQNVKSNARYNTVYGWRVHHNHNRTTLNDNYYPHMDVRAAIDAARKEQP